MCLLGCWCCRQWLNPLCATLLSPVCEFSEQQVVHADPAVVLAVISDTEELKGSHFLVALEPDSNPTLLLSSVLFPLTRSLPQPLSVQTNLTPYKLVMSFPLTPDIFFFPWKGQQKQSQKPSYFWSKPGPNHNGWCVGLILMVRRCVSGFQKLVFSRESASFSFPFHLFGWSALPPILSESDCVSKEGSLGWSTPDRICL